MPYDWIKASETGLGSPTSVSLTRTHSWHALIRPLQDVRGPRHEAHAGHSSSMLSTASLCHFLSRQEHKPWLQPNCMPITQAKPASCPWLEMHPPLHTSYLPSCHTQAAYTVSSFTYQWLHCFPLREASHGTTNLLWGVTLFSLPVTTLTIFIRMLRAWSCSPLWQSSPQLSTD